MDADQYGFLKGGGEIAECIAAKDWSATPLGPIETWPANLRSSVGMMLRSRFPMLIFWGPALTTFYNDAFRPSLGNNGKHPGSLGQPGGQSWSESWPVIGPMIYDIYAGGNAVWFENQKLPLYRDGKMGDAYWTCSFSAIPGPNGEIEGILGTCSETTHALESLENLQFNKDELSFAIDAAELGTWDLNPSTRRFSANNRLKEWFGLKPDENIPLTFALDVIDEKDRQRVSDAINRTMEYESGGRYEMEYVIISPNTGIRRIVLAKGRAWFGEDQKVYRFNGTLQDITERKLAEEANAKSEAKFRSLVEEAPVATCLFTGANHVIEVANELMIKVWGKTNVVIGQPILEALPELHDQPFIDILDDIYRSGKTYSGEAAPAILNVDGRLQTFYFDFTYKPLFDALGRVYGIMNMAVDVTEAVKATKKLEESELFSRSVIENSPVAKIVFTGRDMVLKTVNQSMFQLLQKDESIIGKTYEEVFPELRYTHLPQTMLKVFETGETYTQPEERILLKKNGVLQTGYYSYIYKALKNTDGEIYGIIVTGTDITDQVLARLKTEEAEIRLSGAIELAELSTWSIDIQTKKVTYSPRLQHWLGIKDSILEGENTRVADADRERIVNALHKSMVPGNGNYDEVYTIINYLTGQRRIIHAHGQLSYDIEGKPFELVGVAQDVTLQMELQATLEAEVQNRTEELAAINEEMAATNEELSESNRSLMESNTELEQYAYVASHDLQEPLRKIQVFSKMLREQKDMQEATKDFIEKIDRSAGRMSLLIKDLLEFSQLLKTGRDMKKPVDLNKTVRDVTNDFEILITEKEAVITIENLPVIEAVGLQMNQLFYNLIGNALKFTRNDRKPIITITAKVAQIDEVEAHIHRLSSAKSYVKITVSDNGIGIDPKHSEQIFEVFKRLHGKTDFAGSGIGLALCRRIVNNHEGDLYVESKPGEYTNFHIILPVTA